MGAAKTKKLSGIEAETKTVQLKQREALEYRATLDAVFKDPKTTWGAVFGLALRRIHRLIVQETDDVVSARQDYDTAFRADMQQLAEDLAVKNTSGFVLEDGNRLTFKTDEEKAEYFSKADKLETARTARKTEDLAEDRKNTVFIECRTIPTENIPDGLPAPLLAVVCDFERDEQ